MINKFIDWFGQPQNKKRTLTALFAVGSLMVIASIAMLSGGLGNSNQTLIYYTVSPTDLKIDVTERGNLESQDEVDVICMVDDIRGDEIHGTPIMWIVPNGAAVKKGDLLVQFDSAGHLERLDRQILDNERARAEQIKAKVQYDNQITRNVTSYAEAKLQVDLAKLALEQFEDEEGGTFQISLQDAELMIQEAKASELIEETNLEGVEQLYKLGYRSSGELAQAQLSSLKTKRQLAAAIARRRELLEYEYNKSRMQLEGQVASAERGLKQAERDNLAMLEQAEAAMQAADERFRKEEERLVRYRTQLENCEIIAPQDGMVAYASRDRYSRDQDIREGTALRFRQKILTLPNLRKMQVRTAVHETVLDQIHRGQLVSVRVDAVPNVAYKGSIQSVAVLPDQRSSMSSDTKIYKTIVTIDEDVERLKPGMTAVVEIHIDHLKDVLTVPVQAIVQMQGQTWLYIEAGGGVERRDIQLGRTNDKFVEIKSGLVAGDRAVLNPMAIIDETQTSDRESSPSDT